MTFTTSACVKLHRGLVHQRTGKPIHGLLPLLQMAWRPLAAHVGEERENILAERDRSVWDGCSSQDALGIQPPVLCLSQFSPLRPCVCQRHCRIFADGKLALATLKHIAEGPASAAAFDLELQPLAVAVLAILQAGDGFRGECVREHLSCPASEGLTIPCQPSGYQHFSP